jgi:hypothetical protein
VKLQVSRPHKQFGPRARQDRARIWKKNQFTAPSAIQADPEAAKLALNQLFDLMRPLRLALVGLAVAVALWGFAYKLSLYRSDQNRSFPVNVAKMWLGPKGPSAAAVKRSATQPLQGHASHPVLRSAAVLTPRSQREPLSNPDFDFTAGTPTSVAGSRSPPLEMNSPEHWVAA